MSSWEEEQEDESELNLDCVGCGSVEYSVVTTW